MQFRPANRRVSSARVTVGPAVRPRTRSLAVASALLVILGAAGCGEQPQAKAPAGKADTATAECRGAWRDLGEQLGDVSELKFPSALPSRWNSVTATISYYASSATAKDCGEVLSNQQKAIAALQMFSLQLQPFDMEWALTQVREPATAYAQGPWPEPSGNKGPTKPARPPKPAEVGNALAELTRLAPQASQEQEPGWKQAGVVELSDAVATAQAVKDLQFLASDSAAWLQCAAALQLIRQALAASPDAGVAPSASPSASPSAATTP